MAVRKVQGKKTTLKKKKKKTLGRPPAAKRNGSPDLSSLQLPTGPKEPDLDMGHYTILIYGREKIGKSLLFSGFPDSLFFTTEPGTKGLRIEEFNHEHGGCTDWNIFLRGIDLLEKNPGKYKTIVVDTVDFAYEMCSQHLCDEWGIQYPGVDINGENDWGKSWNEIKKRFSWAIKRILNANLGVCFVSHAKEETIKTRSGDKYTRIFPSMSNQARKVVEALVDMFFYAEYYKDINGVTRRVLICEGDEAVWAGARPAVTDSFPRFLPIEKADTYKYIRAAFMGEYDGIDPAELIPGRNTSKTGKTFMQKTKGQTAKPKLGAKKKKKLTRKGG